VALRQSSCKPGGWRFLQPGGGEKYYSFKDLGAAVDVRAKELLAAGFKKGDRVGLIVVENQEFILTFVGAMSVGIVPVPMYPPLSFGSLDAYVDTAARILERAGACGLVTEKRIQSVLWSLVGRVKGLRTLVCVEDLPQVDSTQELDLSHIDLDDVAFLQFTSGSTALPKGVVVTHRSLLANLHAIMKHGLRMTPDDVAVSWLPLYHDMGLIGFMLAPMWYATPMVYLSTLDFVKRPTSWLEAVSKYRGTITFAPNFAFALVARRTSEKQLAKLDLSSLKALGCGAEPNHPDTLKAFTKHFAKAGLKAKALLPVYGMAEATLAMTFTQLGDGMRIDRIDAQAYQEDGLAKRRINGHDGGTLGALEYVSCGFALPEHSISIVDDAGCTLPDREVGEVVFNGPSIAAGYFEQEATDVFSDAGLHTGDFGYLVEGELFVTGRKKDIIILNGRNYDPQSVEWEVAEVDGIRKGNVVAFSCPGTKTEELVVVAETRAGISDDLREAVKVRVRESVFMTVKEVRLLGPGELPKTSSGKLQRRKTRQQFMDGSLGLQGNRQSTRFQSFVLAKHLSKSVVARMRHGLKRRTAGILGVRRPPNRR